MPDGMPGRERMNIIHVEGTPRGRVFLYALSTCGHCRRTKELLRELGVDFEYVDVDLLEGDEMEEVYGRVMAVNPRGSFPTLLIGERVIVGYREAQIREALADEGA
jgi:glutaredoxin-like protein NrdH